MFHCPLCVTPSTIDKAISASKATNTILRSLNFCRASIVIGVSLGCHWGVIGAPSQVAFKGSSHGLQLSCGGYYERRISQTNSALKNRIAAATTQAMTV